MEADPRHYAVHLRGTWHLVTSRTEAGRTIRELWERRTPQTQTRGFITLRTLGAEWDWVSLMH